jgi:hypothetical protein
MHYYSHNNHPPSPPAHNDGWCLVMLNYPLHKPIDKENVEGYHFGSCVATLLPKKMHMYSLMPRDSLQQVIIDSPLSPQGQSNSLVKYTLKVHLPNHSPMVHDTPPFMGKMRINISFDDMLLEVHSRSCVIQKGQANNDKPSSYSLVEPYSTLSYVLNKNYTF